MLSFLIANLFLAYIIGAPALWTIVTGAALASTWRVSSAITIFSLVFYGVFARFREQACTLACPYGRLMSSLMDAHTVTVTYDWRRGEPRGRLTPRTAAAGPAATPIARSQKREVSEIASERSEASPRERSGDPGPP